MSDFTPLLDWLEERLGPAPIPLHAPCLDERDAEAVAACVRSGFVSSVGEQVRAFEQAVADYTGARHAVAVVNGTAALMLALHCTGVRPGDLVITQSLTFIATANAIRHVGTEPVLLDVDDTLCLSSKALETFLDTECDGPVHKATGRRIGAIVPMHTLGFVADMPRITQLAEQADIPVVEDAAEALGSRLNGHHAGTFGVAGVLSFNGNKLITTGGGGMILTDDAVLAERARHLSTTAKQPHPWRFDHDETAWNLRLPNLNAALGLSQVKKLPQLLEFKKKLAAELAEFFASSKNGGGPVPLGSPLEQQPNHWLLAVQVGSEHERDGLLEAGQARSIQLRPFWTPLHQQKPYEKVQRFGALSHSEKLFATTVCLPSMKRCAYG